MKIEKSEKERFRKASMSIIGAESLKELGSSAEVNLITHSQGMANYAAFISRKILSMDGRMKTGMVGTPFT